MPKLFERTTINKLTLSNRFIRSATWEGMADSSGACTPKLIEHMMRLVQGGVELIITSHSYVSREGQADPWQLGIYGDELVDGFAEMTDAVHKADGEIVMQLAHAGCHADAELTKLPSIGPSAMKEVTGINSREMSRVEIQDVVEAFGRAADRARRAGFDGV